MQIKNSFKKATQRVIAQGLSVLMFASSFASGMIPAVHATETNDPTKDSELLSYQVTIRPLHDPSAHLEAEMHLVEYDASGTAFDRNKLVPVGDGSGAYTTDQYISFNDKVVPKGYIAKIPGASGEKFCIKFDQPIVGYAIKGSGYTYPLEEKQADYNIALNRRLSFNIKAVNAETKKEIVLPDSAVHPEYQITYGKEPVTINKVFYEGAVEGTATANDEILIKEIKAPEGYKPSEFATKEGLVKSISAMNPVLDSNPDAKCFRFTQVIEYEPIKQKPSEPVSGDIKVLTSMTEADGNEFTAYKDVEKANVAQDRTGVYKQDMPIGANGEFMIENLDYGDYYVAHTKVAPNYAQDKIVHPVKLDQPLVVLDLRNTDSKDPNEDPQNHPDYIARQLVNLTLNVKDGKDAPVKDAVYELFARTDLEAVDGTTIAKDTKLGEYTTDENGQIKVTNFKDMAGNGRLVNGQYEFVQKSGPSNVVNGSSALLDATWNDSNVEPEISVSADIALGKTNVVIVVADAKTNTPIADADAKVMAGDNVATADDPCEFKTAAEGNKIAGLPAGDYTLNVVVPGYHSPKTPNFTVENKGEEQKFTVTLDPTAVEVKGNVDGAEYEVKSGDIKEKLTGNGTVEQLPIGPVEVTCTKVPNGYTVVEPTKQVEIIDGTNPAPVEFEFKKIMGRVFVTQTEEVSHKPLEGIKHELRVAGSGEVAAVLITNAEGKADTTDKPLDIATFDENGVWQAPIDYELYLIEDGKDAVKVSDVKFDTTTVNQEGFVDVTINATIHNSPIVTAQAAMLVNGNDYAEFVPVVKNGDNVQYKVTVNNAGTAPAVDVIVKAVVPAGAKFVKAENGNYDEATNTVTWVIDKIDAGNNAIVALDTTVESAEAIVINYSAKYTMPEVAPENKDQFVNPEDASLTWNDLSKKAVQTVKVVYTSSVEAGNTKETAGVVKSGDKLTYTVEVTTADAVNGIKVTDKIPNGMKLLSAKVNDVAIDPVVNPDTKALEFAPVNTEGADTVKFSFEVEVEAMAEASASKYYENKPVVNAKRVVDGEELTFDVAPLFHRNDNKWSTEVKTDNPTFVGNPEDMTETSSVTVLKKGDQVTHSATVQNEGSNTLNQLFVSVSIPDGMKVVGQSAAMGGQETKKAVLNKVSGENVLVWTINDVNPGDKLDLNVKFEVADNNARLYKINTKYGSYTSTEQDPFIPTDVTVKNAADILYQSIKIEKLAVGPDGKTIPNTEDPIKVGVGEKISYEIKINTKAVNTNFNLSDTVPEGLKILSDSINYKVSDNGEWQKLDAANVVTEKESVKISLPQIAANDYQFRFDAEVLSIPGNSAKNYMNKAFASVDKYPFAEKTDRVEVESEIVRHMASLYVEADASGNNKTYIGDFETRKDVTTVKDGDEITYIINVKNAGTSNIVDLDVRDTLPEGVEFISADNDGKFSETDRTVMWDNVNVPKNESKTLTIKVKVATKNEALNLRNKTDYRFAEEEWKNLPEIIYQTTKLTYKASVEGGTTEKDAKYLKIGSDLTYTATFTAPNEINEFKMIEMIPKGVTFDKKSVKFVTKDNKEVDAVTAKTDDSKITFTADKLPGGEYTVSFTVKIDEPKDDKDVIIMSKVSTSQNESASSDKVIEMESQQIFHKANKDKDPQLGFEGTSEIMLWSVIAIMAAAATCALGYYGFFKKKK